MEERGVRVQHACVSPSDVVDPNRSTWLLGHTHSLEPHEVYWSTVTKKTSPADLLRLMAGKMEMDQVGTTVGTNAGHTHPSHHLWRCKRGISSTDASSDSGSSQDAERADSPHKHGLSADNLWIAETWSHVVQMLSVQHVVTDPEIIRSPLVYIPCPNWQCQCAAFEVLMSKNSNDGDASAASAETLTKIQGKAVFGGMFDSGEQGKTMVVFVTSARSSSTPIDAIRPLVEVVSALGASTVHFVMRSAMIAKSAKTIKSEFRDMRILFWTEALQSFDWFNNAMCSPLAVVSVRDHDKMDATLGYLKQSYEHLSPLKEGPISERFGLSKGDVVHSQRTIPKLTRSLRRFDG